MRQLLVTASSVLVVLVAAGTAPAQGFGGSGSGYGRYGRPNYGPGYRGNISPYLNLSRFSNNNFNQTAGINYYLGTRSEQQRRAQAQQFGEEIRGLYDVEQNIITSGTQPQRGTVQRYFNNTGGFFPPVGR
jgi:hypothetical protein